MMVRTKSAIARLKERENRLSKSSDVADTIASANPEQNPGAASPSHENASATVLQQEDEDQELAKATTSPENSDDDMSRPKSSMELVAQIRQIEKQNKENMLTRKAFNERQPDAQRVEWDDQTEESKRTVPPRSYQKPEKMQERRNGNEESGSSSDDGAFEQDSRPLKPGRRREQLHETRRRPINVREHESSAQPQDDRVSGDVASSDDTEGNRGRYVKASQYKLVNHAAKESFALNAPKQPQSRRAWSDEEVEALMEYMDEYGCSWAAIKSADADRGFLVRRSQVDLKDKARNMKYDYLK